MIIESIAIETAEAANLASLTLKAAQIQRLDGPVFVIVRVSLFCFFAFIEFGISSFARFSTS